MVMAVELIVSFLLIQESGDPQRVVVLALIFAALNSFLPAFFGNLSIWLLLLGSKPNNQRNWLANPKRIYLFGSVN